ncbi:hypothetical protein [Micromonospora sp. NPDC005324]|uniref:hypothetical protein n=1 Tax=Micromonospora sp. NPDC005324 TaxID=3157033 RepID=UPI0033A68AC5
MRRAVQVGRRTGQDEAAMNSAIQNCRAQVGGQYIDLARGWLSFIDSRADTVLVLRAPPDGTPSPDLTVRVTPDLVLAHADGTTLA